MIKIAIPLFGARIAPRFDQSERFLLVKVENGEVIERHEITASGLTLLGKVKKMKELDIDTLICSGIDITSAQQLGFNGIRIYSWVTGDAEDALHCFLGGRMEPGTMIGAGGHCRGKWRFIGRNESGERGQRGRGRGHGFGHGRGKGRS